MRPHRPTAAVLTGALGLVLLAGCGQEPAETSSGTSTGDASDTSSPSESTSPSPSESASPSASESSAAGQGGLVLPRWRSGPSSAKGGKLGQTVVTNVRTGTHDGYDRVVVDFRGPKPTWNARYQRRFVQDGSGAPVRIRGRSGLALTLQAAGYDEDYKPVYRGPKLARTGYPAIKAWAVTGDFEGYFGLGFALRKRVPYRVFTLTKPDRLVLDFQQ